MKTVFTPKTLWRIALGTWGVALCGILFCYLGPSTQKMDPPMPPIGMKHPTDSTPTSQYIPLAQALQSPPFVLKHSERTSKLPDLRNVLVYYGCNGRPDLQSQRPKIQFGIRGAQDIQAADALEKIFLRFDFHSNRWLREEHPTPLYAIITPSDTSAEVHVELQDESGLLKTPEDLSHFKLATTTPPATRTTNSSWTIGAFSVDSSILDRLGASWYGKDGVLQTLGGKDMEDEAACERIEFHHETDSYAIFVRTGDYLAFYEDRWKKVPLGEESSGRPLLQVRNVDDSTITFHLWSADGTHQLPVVIRKRVPLSKPEVPEIRILGVRSPKSISISVQGKKLIVSPYDWIVLSQNDACIIDSEELLESYMQGQLKGTLLALNGFEKDHRERNLIGTFFDLTRTESTPISVSMYRSWTQASPKKEEGEEEEDFDVDDEEDDDEEAEEPVEDDEDDRD